MDGNTDFDTLLLDSFDAVLQSLPDDNRTELCSYYAILIFRRFQRWGQTQDLEEGIEKARWALQGTPLHDEDYAGRLNNLGVMLDRRYERTAKMEDLEEAIRVSRQAVKATPEDHPDLAGRLSSLGNKLESRYTRMGKMEDLEEAIRLSRQAVEVTPKDHPHLAGRLNYLGNKLGRRYERVGKMENLEEAIRVSRQAVEITLEDHPDLAAWLNNLGNKLGRRYERTGKMENLEEAIRVSRQAVEVTPEDHPNLAGRLNSLGNNLENRYTRMGKMEDLEEAIRVSRQAVEVTPEDHPRLAGCLHYLGNKLGRRYERVGKMENLEEAIRVSRQAVELTPRDHPNLAARLNSLGNNLGSRYERTGKMEDVEEAIRVSRQAVEATPKDHPDLAAWLNNLGNNLGRRYERTGKMEDLEEAIRVSRQAVKVTSKDHPHLAVWLNNLGNKLESRYERVGKMEDLEEAIRVSRQAVEATPKDHPDLAAWLNNLGNKLGRRYERTGKMEDLEEAIRVSRQAVEVTPEDYPNLANFLINFSRRLFSSHSNNDDPLALLLRAWNCSNALPLDRIRAAALSLLLLQERGDYNGAYKLSVEAIDLLPRVHSRALSLQDQQYVVSLFSGLATYACSLALQTGEHPATALNLLERGRGVILGLLMDDRSDIAELKVAHPALCAQYESLRVEVNKPVDSITDQQAQQIALKRRYDPGNEIDKLIIEIREKPGFEDFLLGPSGGEMQDAASDGPIVVINVGNYRCDAILLEQHQVRSLALPNLNSKEIKEKAQRDGLGSHKVLEWLWDVVTNPILDALGFNQPPSDDNWPRVWWIPTGPLSKFPLHTAGRHTKGSSETVLDRVMSSYSSSVKAIIHSRRRPVIPSTSAQALLVAMEHTPGQYKLPLATEEVAMLHGLCKSITVHPIEPRRCKQDIMFHLPNCKIFHFAGHGHTDNFDPSQSSLLLQDWKSNRLTVATLLEMNIRERSPFLAYLSACGTGQIKDEKFVDESIHLVSACQLAGFRHVIGTLWEVNDELCVDMARITYEGMRDGGMTDESVRRGLHKAIRTLRDCWLNMPAKARRGSRSVRGVVAPLVEDETGARSASDGDQRDVRLPRDVILCDDDDDEGTGPLHWVPYVHFGV